MGLFGKAIPGFPQGWGRGLKFYKAVYPSSKISSQLCRAGGPGPEPSRRRVLCWQRGDRVATVERVHSFPVVYEMAPGGGVVVKALWKFMGKYFFKIKFGNVYNFFKNQNAEAFGKGVFVLY